MPCFLPSWFPHSVTHYAFHGVVGFVERVSTSSMSSRSLPSGPGLNCRCTMRLPSSSSRVIVRDSYNYYEPRDRYYERRTYRDRDDGPRAGVGIRTPGVSVGVGVGGDRW